VGCVSIEIFAKWYAHGVRRNALKAVPTLKVLFEFAGLLNNGHFKSTMTLRAGQFVGAEEVGWFHSIEFNVG